MRNFTVASGDLQTNIAISYSVTDTVLSCVVPAQDSTSTTWKHSFQIEGAIAEHTVQSLSPSLLKEERDYWILEDTFKNSLLTTSIITWAVKIVFALFRIKKWRR